LLLLREKDLSVRKSSDYSSILRLLLAGDVQTPPFARIKGDGTRRGERSGEEPEAMDTMRGALERAKMLVGMEVDEESALPPEEQSFFDDINRQCTLNTTQASTHAPHEPLSYPLSWIRGPASCVSPQIQQRISLGGPLSSRGSARNRAKIARAMWPRCLTMSC
jgi:hypothetical protein